MASQGELFLREGLRRWGRAQLVLDAFEQRLGAELARVGMAHVASLGLAAAKHGGPRVADRGKEGPTIRVEFNGRYGKKPAELILGIEWAGSGLEPRYYAAFYQPPELTRLDGILSAKELELGIEVADAERRHWVTIAAGDHSIDEGFGLLLGVLRRKAEASGRISGG